LGNAPGQSKTGEKIKTCAPTKNEKVMALIPYRGGWDVDRWFEGDDDWFDWGPSFKLMKAPNMPKVDVYEKEGKVVVEAELPGFKPEEISAQIKDGVLTIEGESKKEEKEGDEKKDYWRREISRSYVKRAIALPEIAKDKAEAEFKDGVLKIIAPKIEPKIEEEKVKKLEIKSK
jgi:HSP20 family protein